MRMRAKRNDHEIAKSAGTSLPGGVHPQLRGYTGYCFCKTAARFRSLIDEALASYGVIAPQLGMLSLLRDLGPMNQIELGQVTRIDKATMVRMIDGLESKGYLSRVSAANDRRAKRLELTALGASHLKKMILLREATEERFLSVLKKTERTQLKEIIRKLADAYL